VVEGRTRYGINALALAAFLLSLGSDAIRVVAGWPVLAALGLALVAGVVVVLARLRPASLHWYSIPKALVAVVAWAFIAAAFSPSPADAALAAAVQLAGGVAAAYLACVTTWHELMRTLGRAIRYLLFASLVFEIVVAWFVRQPVARPWEAGPAWSEDRLLAGGPIQGIVGDADVLGFIALLGIVVFGVEYAARTVRRPFAAVWFVVAALALALARPDSALIALGASAIGFGLALWGRAIREDRRQWLYAVAAVAAVVAIAGIVAFRIPLLGSDAWLQSGVVGAVLLALLAAATLGRTWFRAVDRPRRTPLEFLPYGVSTIAPLVVVVAVLVQSLSQPEALGTVGWTLFAAIAIKVKVDADVPSLEGDLRVRPWRETPIAVR